jgi:hypothetical protein
LKGDGRMKKFFFIGFVAFLFLALPLMAFASRRGDIEDTLDEWISYAEDEDYTVLDTDYDELNGDDVITYTIDLEEGDYAVLAEGGENIADLDLKGYYQDDYDDGDDPFIEDVLDDNVPILEFSLRHSETIVIEVFAYEYDEDEDNGYYCILFLQEEGNDNSDDHGRHSS